MNKGFKKLSTILLSILLILFSFTKVNAATGKITVSSSTSKIVVGNTFTVIIIKEYIQFINRFDIVSFNIIY